MTYRFFVPASTRAATGLVAEVYRQSREDFLGPVPTLQVLSPAPDLLAGTWALLREALLAGDTDRTSREVVAAAVSRANRCQFCVDAHVTMLHALGEHDVAETIASGGTPREPRYAELAAWAADPVEPRFGRPEITATLLAFHFINRIVSALLTPDLLPGGLQRFPMVRSAGGRLYARAVRERREPGQALEFIPDATAPEWAANRPAGVAYASLRDVAFRGGELLGEAARRTVTDAVSHADPTRAVASADPVRGALPADLVRAVPPADRVGTRIALLAAFAPASISREDVGLWRLSHPERADLVRIVAFGAITATDHVARAFDPAHH